MRKFLLISFFAVISFIPSNFIAQSFLNGSALLPSEYHSGGCVGFTDMDGDGFDDVVVLDLSRTFTCSIKALMVRLMMWTTAL